jgi:hypothetical protein
MSAQYLSCRILSADQIGPYRNATISMGPMRTPLLPTDASSKGYVDSVVGISTTYNAPLTFDPITRIVGLPDAGVATTGVITSGVQSIGGAKTFAGSIAVPSLAYGDSSTMAANSSFVQGAAKASSYEASNGWVSGGLLTLVPGGTSFSMSSVTCRFVNYTDESNPVVGQNVVLPQQLNVLSLHPGSSIVGVYISATGTITQDADVDVNVPLLYGTLVHLGNLVHRAGVLVAVSNSKFPASNRCNLVDVDFMRNISPFLMSGSSISASITPPADLSLWASDATIWQQMGNVMVSRINPSTVVVPSMDRPTMSSMWRNNAGSIIISAGGTQLDVHNYNPLGTGAALVEITNLFWVNIPILYDANTDAYIFQYPTAEYATSDYALSMVGKFERLGPELRSYVIRGYVTVLKDSVDLSGAFFSDGEYFNYTVGNSTPGGIATGGTQATRTTNTAWVDPTLGDDATGVVSFANKPFATHNGAAAAITTATFNNQFVVQMSPGPHPDPTIVLRPNVLPDSSVSSACYITNAVTLHPDFAAAAFARGGFSNVYVRSTVDMDLHTIGGATTSYITCSDSIVDGNFGFAARALPDSLALSRVTMGGTFTMVGGFLMANDCEMSVGKITIDATAIETICTMNAIHGTHMDITNGDSGVNCNVYLKACTINGIINIDGHTTTLHADRSSVSNASAINLLNGGTLDIVDDPITQDEIAAIKNATIPLTAANEVVDASTLSTALGTKVDKTITVNGHALSANVTVGAAELGAGTVPRAQLPLPWLSGDIPNNAANTSGSAAFLSAVSTLPDGTLATTQGSVAVPDNSTKVATTAYVDRMRGAISGVATLDGTGKIPAAQIDLGALGALVYKGTWDASTAVYPTPLGLAAGWFYITSVTGTIAGTLYAVGDWMVYDGAAWGKVAAVDIGAYLTTWAGSASVVTVGTLTTGTWNADKIAAAYGGAGGIAGPALLKGTAGVVSAATIDVDYVAPGTVSTIAGDKDFSGALTAVTQAKGDDSTLVATTAYVQASANVPQDNVIFLSSVGNDLEVGATLNDAVVTLSRAVAIAVAGVPSLVNKYVIRCLDTSAYNATNLPNNPFIDVDADSVDLQGMLKLADYNIINCRRISTPAVAKGVLVHFTGGTNTVSSYVTCKRIQAGQIVVDSTQGTRSIHVEYIDGLPLTSDPVITCNADSTLYVTSNKIRGLITATGTNAIIDLTNVGDLTEATFSIGVDPGCSIKFPPGNAGGATGILKSNGFGVITAAVSGTGNDYLKVNDTITLSADVTGSGSNAIATTIAASAVSLAKMANLAASSLIGNPTGAPATPTAVGMSALSSASKVVVRDSDQNAWGNHLTGSFVSHPTSAGVFALSRASPPFIQCTGALSETLVLPDATTVTEGFEFRISNLSTTPIVVQDHDLNVLQSVGTDNQYSFTCTDIVTTAGVWLISNNTMATISLTGAVTGTGSDTIATTIPAGSIVLSKLANLATGNVLGNISGGPLAPYAVPAASSNTVDSLVLRDASGNSSHNNLCTTFNSPGANVVLTVASNRTQYYNGAISYNVTLPAANTLTIGTEFVIINDGTGSITVKNASSTNLLVLTQYMRASFVASNVGSVAGAWCPSVGSLLPMTRLFTNDWNTIINVPTTLTAAQLYYGPIRVSGTTTLTLPTGVNFFSQMTAILGFLPPVGFNFTSCIYSGNATTLNIGGAGFLNGTSSINIGAREFLNATVWVFSATVYIYLAAESPS